MASSSTHCPSGHEWTAENTQIKSNGRRRCRECNRIRALDGMRKLRIARRVGEREPCRGNVTASAVIARLVVSENGCWVWPGSTTNGYGDVAIDGKTYRVHRVVYVHCKGEIPTGHEVDHLCFNRLCANPDHLEAVTREENNRRALAHYGLLGAARAARERAQRAS